MRRFSLSEVTLCSIKASYNELPDSPTVEESQVKHQALRGACLGSPYPASHEKLLIQADSMQPQWDCSSRSPRTKEILMIYFS